MFVTNHVRYARRKEGVTRDDLQWRGLGAGTFERTEGEWSQLIVMLELAQRWHALVGEFSDEDAHSCIAASRFDLAGFESSSGVDPAAEAMQPCQ